MSCTQKVCMIVCVCVCVCVRERERERGREGGTWNLGTFVCHTDSTMFENGRKIFSINFQMRALLSLTAYINTEHTI